MMTLKQICCLIGVLFLSHQLLPARPLPILFEKDSSRDSVTVNSILQRAQQKVALNQPDSAEIYFLRAGKTAKDLRYGEGQLLALAKYANFLFGRQRYNEALTVSQQQLQLSLKLGDKQRTANAYNNIGIQYHVLGKLHLSAQYIIKALRISENLNDLENKQKFYSNLASVFIDLKDKKNSLYYAQKGYETAQALSDSMRIARSLVNLSASEELNGQTDLALRHTMDIARIAGRLQDTQLILNAYVNLGDLYNRKKDYKKALEFYKEADKITRTTPDQSYELYINYGLANTYHHLEDPQNARFYFDKMIGGAEKWMPKADLKDVYLLGSKIREDSRQPVQALSLWKKYSILNDSLLSANTQVAIQEIEIKYRTSLKEKAIAQQKLQLESNKNEIQKKNRFIFISAGVILLLIAVFIIAYLANRNKNQAIELSLLKAQIHPHFLFNTLNNLYSLTLNKADDAPDVVLGLAEILRYILYECNTESVQLSKELDIIKRYISLEKIRYKNRLEINLNLPENVDFTIAPLLILPLVENAFKHGISKRVEDGWINIESKIRKNQFTFKISNNKPAHAEIRAEKSPYGNIGLINIRKRLNILYPGAHELRIADDEDIFLVVMKVTLK